MCGRMKSTSIQNCVGKRANPAHLDRVCCRPERSIVVALHLSKRRKARRQSTLTQLDLHFQLSVSFSNDLPASCRPTSSFQMSFAPNRLRTFQTELGSADNISDDSLPPARISSSAESP